MKQAYGWQVLSLRTTCKANKCSCFYSKKWQGVLDKNKINVIISPVATRRQGGEKFLENYAKVMLYAYPFLNAVDKDYEEHIRNKAILSYGNKWTAEGLAEYIAGEIITKRNIAALKQDLEKVFGKLDEVEKQLLEIRYFGKRKKLRDFLKNGCGKSAWSERKYFRRQQRLGDKLAAMMSSVGLTKERYLQEFACVDIFQRIAKLIDEGRDEKISAAERRVVSCGC